MKIFNNLTFTQALTDDDIKEIKKVEQYTFKEGIIPSEVNIDELINTKLLEDAGIK